MLALGPNRDHVIPEPQEIPEELRKWPNWVVWRYGGKRPDGSRPKVPLSRDSDPISITDPHNWRTFEEAYGELREAAEQSWWVPRGLGLVITGTGLAVVDYDGVLDKNGELVPEVDILADYINSDAKATYTEISPSGTGLHVWYASFPPAMNGRSSKLTLGKRKDGRRVGIEVYGSSDKRYLTVTGRRYKDAPLTLAEG